MMSTDAAGNSSELTRFEQLHHAREILRIEGQALLALAGRIGEEFCDAVELLCGCRGSVLVTGMGKAGLVGQKIAATLASTGTSSHFLHPGEAVHGDLGRIHQDDTILALSYSGDTEELVRLLPTIRAMGNSIIAITGNPASALGRRSTVILDVGPVREACALGLAPSTSTTAMMALGDALALVLSRLRRFGPEDFARFHPGGSLGRKLSKVEDVMRPLSECRVCGDGHSVRQVFVSVSRPGRRSGAIMLTDNAGLLSGIFTDSDLARLLENNRETDLDRPVSQLMTRAPRMIRIGSYVTDAIEILKENKISELPVVDSQGKPRGMIDVTDVVAFTPQRPLPAELLQSSGSMGEHPLWTIPFPSTDTRRLGS